ncbi:hypothetical protein HYD73_03080 [Mycoplasmopsis bovis]|nr:hypothetical protein HYE38_03100 [Mycoplasmopsis bovis]QUE43369.1 hypothetical protein HYD73_03080 [Mycoplasmopsis bovis]
MIKKSKMSEEDIKIKFINPILEKKGWEIGKNLSTEYNFTDGSIKILPDRKNFKIWKKDCWLLSLL